MADKKHQLVNVDFPKETLEAIDSFIEQQLRQLEQSHKELHDVRLPKFRKLYLGIPAEATRNFPFPNAANTVVQVIGETVDTMVARVMGLVYATHPMWPFKSYVKTKEIAQRKEVEAKRQIIEDFMGQRRHRA
jgi:hypothetical protein